MISLSVISNHLLSFFFSLFFSSLYNMMKVRVRDKDRIYCRECGIIIARGEEALLIDDVTLCCSCSIEYLLAKISNLERRIEELEMQNGIAVHV